jgi:SAM-dependent methyltransferase
MLTPEAERRLAPFMRSYANVRSTEGRGGLDPSFYRSLPYPSGLDKRWTRHWQLRAASYETLIHELLPGAERLTILDLGAGNGWLSNRLALAGHNVISIDLQVNDFDGLGCHNQYESEWLPIQAEFDRLPIADRTVDLVIFNASLHYSADLPATLAEAHRTLKPDGRIVVIDSPFFNRESAGRKMLLELPYNTEDQIGFLTTEKLSDAANRLGMRLDVVLRPQTAREAASRFARRLYLLREPASMFPVVLDVPFVVPQTSIVRPEN